MWYRAMTKMEFSYPTIWGERKMDKPIFTEVLQIGIVVDDLDAYMKRYIWGEEKWINPFLRKYCRLASLWMIWMLI